MVYLNFSFVSLVFKNRFLVFLFSFRSLTTLSGRIIGSFSFMFFVDVDSVRSSRILDSYFKRLSSKSSLVKFFFKLNLDSSSLDLNLLQFVVLILLELL